MSETATGNRVSELLAEYLVASGRLVWPGADGLLVEDVVLAEYAGAIAAGVVPTPAELSARHPDLAAAVAAFLGRCAVGPASSGGT